jgi:hypothetical protein
MVSSGNAEPRDDEKVVLTFRVAPALKSRLAAWARERRLTLNAAAIILLDRTLGEDEKPGDRA